MHASVPVFAKRTRSAHGCIDAKRSATTISISLAVAVSAPLSAARCRAGGARVVAIADRGVEDPGLACDVADGDSVGAAFSRVDELLGGVDVLVANAGISIRKPFLEIEEADWRRVLDVNLTGVFFCAQQAARRMAEGGVILMTASTNGLTGHPNYADYNASKDGV